MVVCQKFHENDIIEALENQPLKKDTEAVQCLPFNPYYLEKSSKYIKKSYINLENINYLERNGELLQN